MRIRDPVCVETQLIHAALLIFDTRRGCDDRWDSAVYSVEIKQKHAPIGLQCQAMENRQIRIEQIQESSFQDYRFRVGNRLV